MRGRPRKSLEQLVADGTFLARRHAGLLAGRDVADPTLRTLQQMFRQAGDDRRQRRRVALAFEKRVRAAVEPDVEADVDPVVSSLPESAKMVAKVWPVPWRERGVDPWDGHRPSNVQPGQVLSSWSEPGWSGMSGWQGSSPGESRPPIGPPSEPTDDG